MKNPLSFRCDDSRSPTFRVDEFASWLTSILTLDDKESDDILGFWSNHCQPFSNLLTTARHTFAIPASNTTVKRLFSGSKDTNIIDGVEATASSTTPANATPNITIAASATSDTITAAIATPNMTTSDADITDIIKLIIQLQAQNEAILEQIKKIHDQNLQLRNDIQSLVKSTK
ncbi:unnamed protein product [Rotaria sp. Silwood2]|nr:unnamed protein product [Rotaria sp. Silwood2]CAF4257266.1 unnamed protein product [Rotaria sp. Silwood2]